MSETNDNFLATEDSQLLSIKIQQEEEQEAPNNLVVKISRVSLPADTDLVMLLYYLTTKQYLKIQPPVISQVFVGVDTFDNNNLDQEVKLWKSISSFFPQFGYIGSEEQGSLWENVVRTHLGGSKPVHIKITTRKPLVLTNAPIQIVAQPTLPDPFGFSLMEEFFTDALKGFSSVCDELFDLFFRSSSQKSQTKQRSNSFKSSSRPTIAPELPEEFQQGPSSVIGSSTTKQPFPIFKSSTKLQQSTTAVDDYQKVADNDDFEDEVIEIIDESDDEEIVSTNPLLEVQQLEEQEDRKPSSANKLQFPNVVDDFFKEGSSETEIVPKEQTIEEKYAFQLNILEQMGFTDKEVNLKKLQECEGNFVEVVKSLTME